MLRKSLFMSLLTLFLFPAVILAQGSIKGKVTDASTGDVLPGANIFIQELQRGAATTTDGTYEIENVPGGTYTMVVSFIGYNKYSQSVTVENNTVTADIKLKSSSAQLEDVYVTAYGVKKSKNELAYSAQKVDGEEVTQGRNPDFVGSLSGKIAGLKVSHQNGMGGSTNIVMRGYKSITGNNQVLFVVDGVPYANDETNTSDQKTGRGGYDYGNTATDINPDNIESVNVLKGPAAAALYGSRAANGAVVITTKKGNEGQNGIGITINSSVDVGAVDKSTFAEYQHKYGAGYGAYYESEDGYFLSRDIDGDGTKDLVTPTTEDASYGAPFDPNLMVYQWDALDPTSPNYQQATPWTAAENDPRSFFERSVTATNSIMIDGGMDKGYFTLGYNQTNQTGILPNSDINDHKLNFSGGYDITDKLHAATSLNYTNSQGKGRYGTGYDAKNLMTNFRQWWEVNVDIDQLKGAYFRNRNNQTWNWANTDATGPIYWDNPYWTRYENYETDNRNRYFGNVNLTYDITDWLNIVGRVSVDSYDQLQEERIAKGSIDVPEYERYNRNFAEYNYDLLLNYNKQVSDAFKLSGVVGANIRRRHIKFIRASTNGGLNLDRLYTLSNSPNPIEAPEEYNAELGVNGYFASFNIDYNNLIVLELTGRRDESSSLPEGENVYYYPSASAGFVFSELTDNDWLSYGKLRASVARVGNTAPVYSVTDTYETPTPFGSYPPVAFFSVNDTKNNPDLKPESTESWELGLEMSFFRDRVGFDLTYYNENTFDQIIAAPVSNATGYDFKYINAGEVKNKGIELTINGKPVVTSDFAWTVTANWSKNYSKVSKLASGLDNLELANFQGGVSINATLGEPYGTIRGSDYVYTDDGQRIVGSNGYYETTSSSNQVIGNMNPDWTGSLSNRFQYKNISFNFLIDARWGGDIFSLDQWYGQATGLYPNTAALNDNGKNVRDPVSEGGGIVLDGVNVTRDGNGNITSSKPNDIYASNTSYANAFGYVRNPNAAFVYDASYVKLREVGITYSLPQSFVNKIGLLTNIDVSAIGRNLWIIHKNLPYADPEQALSAGNLQGYQGGAYPSTRNVVFNLRLKF